MRAYREALKQAKPVGKFINDQVGAFTIVHVAETRASRRSPTAAPTRRSTTCSTPSASSAAAPRRATPACSASTAADEIQSTPYRDMIAKEYPIILKMMKNECTFEDLDQEDMVIVGDVDECARKVERYQQRRPRPLHLADAGRPHPAREGDALDRAVRQGDHPALSVTRTPMTTKTAKAATSPLGVHRSFVFFVANFLEEDR